MGLMGPMRQMGPTGSPLSPIRPIQRHCQNASCSPQWLLARMKLFVVVLGCLLVVAFMAWMTLSMQQIVDHRAEMKRVQQIAAQQHHTNAP